MSKQKKKLIISARAHIFLLIFYFLNIRYSRSRSETLSKNIIFRNCTKWCLLSNLFSLNWSMSGELFWISAIEISEVSLILSLEILFVREKAFFRECWLRSLVYLIAIGARCQTCYETKKHFGISFRNFFFRFKKGHLFTTQNLRTFLFPTNMIRKKIHELERNAKTPNQSRRNVSLDELKKRSQIAIHNEIHWINFWIISKRLNFFFMTKILFSILLLIR